MKLHIGHLAWTLALGGLLIATPLQAGLTVVSTYPTDGAVSVNTVLTVEFVFNQPIDTTAQYEITDNFYLGVLLYPDSLIGAPDSITISPDLKTIKVHNLRLVPDTRYVFGIIGARSISGEHLEKPVIITFTTGSSLPTGRIEGQVSLPTGTPAGTLIGVFTEFVEVPVALGVAEGTDH